jgi:hypothetical protein
MLILAALFIILNLNLRLAALEVGFCMLESWLSAWLGVRNPHRRGSTAAKHRYKEH